MAQPPTATVIRSYRIYFRDTLNVLKRGHDHNLGSDEEARVLAGQMLDERTNCSCAEVWDRARLVWTVRRSPLT
jgi:hypothetical protein